MQLYEKYRPAHWQEVVGQDKTIQQLIRFEQRGLAGRSYWINGRTGTGKTTIARLIAQEVAEDWAISEYTDASELTADVVRQMRDSQRRRPFGRGFCYIVNEAHGLNADQIRKLLGLTEPSPPCPWVTWVFTTTIEGHANLLFDKEDAGPLLSRCVKLTLDYGQPVYLAFAMRLQTIAQTEGLDGRPLEDYVALVKRHECNLRAAIMEIEAGAMCLN